MPKKPDTAIATPEPDSDGPFDPNKFRQKALACMAAMREAFTPIKFRQVGEVIIGKAMNGELPFIELVIDQMNADAFPPQQQQPAGPSVVNQISVGSDRSGPVSVHAFDPRDFKKAARFIVDHGPMLPAVAAEEFGISLGALDAMVKAGLFLNEPKGLVVTTAGRREAGLSELRGGLA